MIIITLKNTFLYIKVFLCFPLAYHKSKNNNWCQLVINDIVVNVYFIYNPSLNPLGINFILIPLECRYLMPNLIDFTE